MSNKAADGSIVHRGWSGLRSALALAMPAVIAIACSSAHETEDIGEVQQAASSTGGSKATGGAKATGGKLSTGGSKTTGGTSATGGSKATGGKSSTGGSKARVAHQAPVAKRLVELKLREVRTREAPKRRVEPKPPEAAARHPFVRRRIAMTATLARRISLNSGTCTHTPVTNGTSCNDGNACTQTDSCQNGTCTGSNPVVCAAQDTCHTVGTCNPSTGTCSNPVAPDGTACSDNNACTQTDACQSGTCVGTNPVSVDDGDPCTTDSCDPVLGVQHVPVTDNPNCAQWYSGGLKVEVKTNYCDQQKAQQYFQVTNTGAAPVNLSDISIKYWVYDTSGANVVSDIYYAGCVVTSPSNLTCEHPVTGVSATGTQFPACGPDANHQANWEVTLTPTDSYALQPGHQWNNLQTVVHLDTWANFTPGTSQWYSTCLTSSNYATDPHFSVYYKGNLVFSSGINAPSCRAPHGTQQLSGHIKPAMAAAPLVGPVPPSTTIRLTIGLPLGNALHPEQELKDLVKQVSDPNSPKYRQYLTSETLTDLYGATQAQYDAVRSWAQSSHLSIVSTYSNRLILTVSGTAAAVEQALFLNLNYYLRPDGTQFYALDREPSLSLPATSATVEYIGGLENYFVSRPKWGFGPGSINASDLRARYLQDPNNPNCPVDNSTWNGDGQCIGILSHATFDPNDVNTFASNNGLGTPSVTVVSVDGFDTTQPAGTEGTIEVESDIEIALAMAPRAAIRVYEGNDAASILNTMATDPVWRCNQLNMSWIYDTNSELVHVVTELLPPAHQSLFTPTGDWGAYPTNPLDYEDGVGEEANFITFVGGTDLNKITSNSYSETAWPLGGGGIFDGAQGSSLLSIPDYQLGLLNGASGSYRNVPDVAAEAESEVTVFLTSPDVNKVGDPNLPGHDSSYACDWGTRTGVAYVGGTSISSPIWAGFTAVVNQVTASRGLEPVGFLNPTLYAIGKSAAAYSASFYDIGGDGQVSGLNTYTGVSNGCPSSSLAYLVGERLDF